MPRRLFYRLSVFVLLFPATALAWRSALYPENWTPPSTASFYADKLIQDFSQAGYRRGSVSLPSASGPVFDVVAGYDADPTGMHDSTVAIQNAIDAAAATSITGNNYRIVYFPAGTYRLSPQGTALHALRLTSSRIVLRGESVHTTFLLNASTTMKNKSVILVGPSGSGSWRSDHAPRANIASDLIGPTTQIPVASVAGFSVGQWVMLRTDVTQAWVDEHRESNWVGHEANLFGGLVYPRRITALDASNQILTVDLPTRYTMRMRDGARVHSATAMLEEIGLEELSLGNVQHPGTSGWGETDWNNSSSGAFHADRAYLITLNRVFDSWVRNVRSYQPAGNTTGAHMLSSGLHLDMSCAVTVRDCHFQRPQYGGGNGNGYMIRFSNAADNLLANVTAERSRHGFVFSMWGSSGNVLHRCSDLDSGFQTGASGSEATLGRDSDHHMWFSHSNLIDQCLGRNSAWVAYHRPYTSSPWHGTTAAHSIFWNTRGEGTARSFVVHTYQGRYGYAIGTQGSVTAVRSDKADSNTPDSVCQPIDHVEGVGQGATLEPASLYLDQVSRRYTSFRAWVAAYPLASDQDGTLDDPDADGLPNLIEYALDQDPTSAVDAGTAIQILDSDPDLIVTFQRARAELTYAVEASSDLVTWTTIATNPGTLGLDVSIVDSNASQPASRFLRLRVTSPETVPTP